MDYTCKICMNFKSYRIDYHKDILNSRTVFIFFCHLVMLTIATCNTENKKIKKFKSEV